jgi:hypothetical protein
MANRFYLTSTFLQAQKRPLEAAFFYAWQSRLSDYFTNNTSAYSTAAFTNSETKTFIHRDWCD